MTCPRLFAAAALSLLLATNLACTTTETVEPAETAQPEDVPPAPPPAAPLPDLWEAAGAGDIDGLEGHRRAGTNLNSLHPEAGFTPLVATVVAEQDEALEWLLANGADADARNGDGGTALIAATFLGLPEAAGALLASGADPAASNDEGQTLWDIAALDWETTRYIADFLELDIEREAVEAGRAEILEMLQPQLAALSADDIWLATATGNIEAVRTLLADVDVNQRSPDTGTTLLTLAALFGHTELAALLLDAGADVNGRNYQDGSTALHAAAFLGQAEAAQLLLERGADINAVSDDGSTPLATAEVDWDTTQTIARMLQVPVQEEAVVSGKAKVVELLKAQQ